MKVYVSRKLPGEVMAVLRKPLQVCCWPGEEDVVPREILMAEVSHARGLLCMLTERVDQELLDAAPSLKIVSNMAVGYDNIDIDACTRRGVLVTNTPGVLTETTADLAFALMMATARRLPEAQKFLLETKWSNWAPMLLAGKDIYGATLGIIGMGRIGQAVAHRASGFGMKVLYCNRRRNEKAERELNAEYRDLDDLLREADFVSIHVPLSESTRHLIGQRELSLMKRDAILVNTSRGAVVDEKALCRALEDGTILGAGLDVFEKEPLPSDSPLRTMENVVLLPHVGSATVATRIKMGRLAARNLAGFLLEGRAVTPVNAEALAR